MKLCNESSTFANPFIPFILYRNQLKKGFFSDRAYWRENIIIIFLIEGEMKVLIDSVSVHLREGEIAIINSNCIHKIFTPDMGCTYYCIIPSNEYCYSLGIDVTKIEFINKISDSKVKDILIELIDEMDEKKKHYTIAARALIDNLFLVLCRDCIVDISNQDENTNSERIETFEKANVVKKAINYLNENCCTITNITDIWKDSGYSKYYFCRLFKEYTGRTIVDYLNMLRCKSAKIMLLSGLYSITEVAHSCGFNSDSYFSKIYKKYIGVLPSETRHKPNENEDT